MDWLEKEIASLEASRAEGIADAPPPMLNQPQSVDPSGDDILEEFRQHPDSIGQRTKVGCLVYFLIFLGFLALVLGGIHLFESAYRTRH